MNRHRWHKPPTMRRDLGLDELQGIVDCAKTVLCESDHPTLVKAVQAVAMIALW